jgi:hypothetical protein
VGPVGNHRFDRSIDFLHVAPRLSGRQNHDLLLQKVYTNEVLCRGNVFHHLRHGPSIRRLFVVTNLGSTDAEDQGNQAAEVTDKLVLIATPIAGDGIGTFVAGSPAEDPGIGQQITDEINRSFTNLSDLFLGFVGLHSDPPNCNGIVLIDTLTFLPGELAKAANVISSRDYTGPQTNDRCGGAPESTINFHIDRFTTGGISPPEA